MPTPASTRPRGRYNRLNLLGALVVGWLSWGFHAQAQTSTFFQERDRVIAEIVAQGCTVDEAAFHQGTSAATGDPARTYNSTVATLQAVGLIVPGADGIRRLRPEICTPADTPLHERVLAIFRLEGCRAQVNELSYWYQAFGLEALAVLEELATMYQAGDLVLDATATRLVIGGEAGLAQCTSGRQDEIRARVDSVIADLERTNTCTLPLAEFTQRATRGLVTDAPAYTRMIRAFTSPDPGAQWGAVALSYSEGTARLISASCAPEAFAGLLRDTPDVQPLAAALASRDCRLVPGEHGAVVQAYPEAATLIRTELPLLRAIGILHGEADGALVMDRAYCPPSVSSGQAEADPSRRQVLLELFARHDCVLTPDLVDAEGAGIGLTRAEADSLLRTMTEAGEVAAQGPRFKLLAPLCPLR